jgi:hypothetical protein
MSARGSTPVRACELLCGMAPTPAAWFSQRACIKPSVPPSLTSRFGKTSAKTFASRLVRWRRTRDRSARSLARATGKIPLVEYRTNTVMAYGWAASSTTSVGGFLMLTGAIWLLPAPAMALGRGRKSCSMSRYGDKTAVRRFSVALGVGIRGSGQPGRAHGSSARGDLSASDRSQSARTPLFKRRLPR